MKIVYQNVIYLLFFVAYNYMSLADDQKHVDIVGFFDEESEQTLLAYKTAVHNFNSFGGVFQYVDKTIVVNDTDCFKNKKKLCDLFERSNLVGVICPTSPKVAPIIESVCQNLEIPAIQISWRPSPVYFKNSLIVNFYPYSSLLVQGLKEVVKNLQWRSFVIFYESVENLVGLQGILELQKADSKYNSIILKELGPGPNYRPVLKQIQNISELRIILDCKTEKIIPIMKQAQELNLLEKQFSYFLTSLDAHTLDLNILGTEANITTVRIVDVLSDNFKNAVSKMRQYVNVHHSFYSDLDSWSVKTETALMYDAVNTYINALEDQDSKGNNIDPRHLSCNEENEQWENGLAIASFLRSRTCESSSCIAGPMRFDNFGRRVDFNLSVVDGNREEVIAVWNPNSPNKLNFLKSEEDRNQALMKKWKEGEIVVASILGKPYLMKREKPADGESLKGNDRYEGFSMDLMKELANELGIKYRFEVREDGQRGKYDEKTKSWNGLVKDILDRKADLGICDFTITPERREVVDFSSPFMQLGISILLKKPEAKKADLYAFLDPFSFGLWIYTATLYLAITVVIYFIARFSPQDWENPNPADVEPEELENIWNMKNSLWLTLGTIMTQGCDILPKGAASRMVVSMWWFYAFIVPNSYMANLAAFLTNERSQGSINGAADLVKQTKIKYGTMKDGSTESFFKTSNFSTYARMWTVMQQTKPSVFELTNDAGVTRVQTAKDRGYAFLMESATLEYQIQTKCDLMQVGDLLDSKSYGIAMPLDYPFRSDINEALLNLNNGGKIRELKKRWWEEKRNEPLCPKSSDEGPTGKLSLENFGGVFIVLAAGIGLAYIVAICEFLWNVWNVAVEEHISFVQALRVELLFAVNVRLNKKRVKPQVSEKGSSHSGSRSLSRSILQSGRSLMGLDIVSKVGTPSYTRRSSRSRTTD